MIALLRPHQWTKNLFVLVGTVFGHAWGNSAQLYAAGMAFIAFCAISSAAYILNDWVDRTRDAAHPQKRNRALASGKVSGAFAAWIAGLLVVTAFGVAYLAAPGVMMCIAAYAVLNALYSRWLKHVVVIDVFCIAGGFMLRILAGTHGIGIPASSWLLFCGGMLTLFLAFAKRRGEIATLPAGHGEDIPRVSSSSRPVLDHYTLPLLDNFLVITAACCVIAYGLYTMSAETIRVHGTAKLIYTLPLVLYGLFRYLYLLQAGSASEDISRDFLRDWHLCMTVAVWLVVTVSLIL